MADAVQIDEVRADDLEALTRFLQREGPAAPEAGSSAGRRVQHLHWFLFENPAQPAGVPRGWIARDAQGQVVGSKFCVGQRFQCAGDVFTLLMGGGFYVAASRRGLGLALMRRYLEQGRAHALFASTMNEVSGAIYEHYGGYSIPHTDHEWLGVLRYAPLVEELIARRTGRPQLARLLAGVAALRPAAVPRRPRGGELTRIPGPAELAGLAIPTPPEHASDVTAIRDAGSLRWRYFEGPDASRALFVYRSERGDRALVGTNLRPRGVRGQVRALMVLDYWGALPPAEIANVASHLAAAYRDEADVIVFRGQPPERQRVLKQAGFVYRALARAVGVCIDPHGILPTRSWYMVPADGDMGH